MDSKKIGAFIACLRKEHSMTQKDLAEQLNVTNKAVSKWETGEGYPEITIISALAEVLGVTTDELLKGERYIFEEKPPLVKKQGEKTARGEYLLNNSLMKFKTFNLLSIGLSLLGVIAFFTITLSTYYEILGFGVQMTLLVTSGILFMIAYNNIKSTSTAFSKMYPEGKDHLDCITYANRALIALLWMWTFSILTALPYIAFDDRTYAKSIITFETYLPGLMMFLIIC